MAQKQKKQESSEYDALVEAVKSGRLSKLYFFYGEERYLLEYYLERIREQICPGELGGFNHRRFDGQKLDLASLLAACETLPVFSGRTLVEVRDFDPAGVDEDAKSGLASLFFDLPEHVCVIFVCGPGELKLPAGDRLASAIRKNAKIVNFPLQEQPKLVKWIRKHFAECGKDIDAQACEYLAFVTGGAMTTLKAEIEKLCLYVRGNAVTREDIDEAVTPVPDAAAYKLADHVASGRFGDAAAVLSDLLKMREAPHKILFYISLKLRQLMLARLCLEGGHGDKRLVEAADIKYGFQARNLMSSARKTPLERCCRAVLLCAEAARRMNTESSPELVLIELLGGLAVLYGGGRDA